MFYFNNVCSINCLPSIILERVLHFTDLFLHQTWTSVHPTQTTVLTSAITTWGHTIVAAQLDIVYSLTVSRV